jgi:hypothetical protein
VSLARAVVRVRQKDVGERYVRNLDPQIEKAQRRRDRLFVIFEPAAFLETLY